MENETFESTADLETTLETADELVDVKIVNRSVLIAHLNEEFYSWYKNVSADPVNMDEVLDTPHTFLIPPVEDEEEVEDYIAENFFVIFEALLEEYIEDEELLVEALTEENFDKWIDYNFSTFVMDAASDYELGYEEDEIIAGEEEVSTESERTTAEGAQQ